MNIERPTSNVEWEKMKKQTYDLEGRLKRNHALAWLNVRYWVFVFSLDVRII